MDVLSSDAVKISPGNKVILENWGGKQLLGIVRLIEPSAFTKISALGVEEQRVNIVIDFIDSWQKKYNLGDGYRMEARIIIWENDCMKVPISALFRIKKQWAVFFIRDHKAMLKTLKLGHWGRLEVEVLEGLSIDDAVVIHPSDKIKDGSPVVLRKSQN